MTDEILNSCISASDTIEQAMRKMSDAATGVALIIAENRDLKGIIVDGDIRRALLAGATLGSKASQYMTTGFTSVAPDANRSHVLELMQSRLLQHIPIVSRDGKLIGLHLIHRLLGAVVRPNWAVIMAGGKGTRLAPITDQLPKPMIKVAGRPILERLVHHLVGFGIQRIFLSVNYLSQIIKHHFQDGSRFGCAIEYLDEEVELGSAGALSLLPGPPTDPVVVLNGDLVTEANLSHLLDYHLDGSYSLTIATVPYLHHIPFGCLEQAGDAVAQFIEKPLIARAANAGIYVLDPGVIGGGAE